MSMSALESQCYQQEGKGEGEWQPLMKVGQINVGDVIKFKIGSQQYFERAKEILNPGAIKEEVIYNKKQNFYFITSMVLGMESNHKVVEVFKKRK